MGLGLTGLCHIWVDTTNLFNKRVVFMSKPRNLFDSFN